MQFINKPKTKITKKLKSYRANSLSRGAATLVTTLIISSIILVIAVFGAIISVIFLNSAYNERLASEALIAARSGAQDAIIRVVRHKNCPSTPNCPASYSMEFNDRSVDITIVDNEDGTITVTSSAKAVFREKKMVAELEVNDITGMVRVQSFIEEPI